jgi:hypothetical protein
MHHTEGLQKNSIMKIKFYFLILLFTVELVSAQTGFLDLKTEPADANIYIDGVDSGKAPKMFTLPVGNHSIEVKYENYETSSLTIKIVDRQVLKQTIVLKKAEGFKVVGIETDVVNQAKGQLTVITDPDKSDVYIDGIKVNQQTPLTVTELGAGDHTIKVTNYVYQNGEYKPYSITKDVHVKPNETELLNINFSDFFGILTVKSNPTPADIDIDGSSYGKTPKTIDFLSSGDHKLGLTAYLESPYNTALTIHENFSVIPHNETSLYYDFYDRFKLGSIVLKSNIYRKEFKLENLDYSKTFTLNSSNEIHKILTGEYSIKWEDTKTNYFDFDIFEDKITVMV